MRGGQTDTLLPCTAVKWSATVCYVARRSTPSCRMYGAEVKDTNSSGQQRTQTDSGLAVLVRA